MQADLRTQEYAPEMPNLGSNHERSGANRGPNYHGKETSCSNRGARLGRLSQAVLHRLARHPDDAQYPRGINLIRALQAAAKMDRLAPGCYRKAAALSDTQTTHDVIFSVKLISRGTKTQDGRQVIVGKDWRTVL